MLSALTAVTFLATVLILVALVYAFSPGESRVAARLEQLKQPAVRAQEEKFAEKHKERARDLLARVGSLLPATAGARANRSQIMMMRAGYRSSEATLAVQGMKILTPIALVVLVFITGIYKANPFLSCFSPACSASCFQRCGFCGGSNTGRIFCGLHCRMAWTCS